MVWVVSPFSFVNDQNSEECVASTFMIKLWILISEVGYSPETSVFAYKLLTALKNSQQEIIFKITESISFCNILGGQKYYLFSGVLDAATKHEADS
jgi:hypothetical protein